ncbi:zinc finger RNA-binding protein isoform X2 [Contarinia nasturtii]|uniref:zinc finger RNA-binding protein isoform X2 n=1 Tax=Contarinia nasturtii TaxID=265458 RepID=UPI0012D458B4|nr:zinc finger RNA-binding protein isoform X2 [Contarinia nasturtii]
MSANNYFGFTHGGTQYGAAATGPTYPAAQQYNAVAPTATAATYSAQRTGAYDQAAYQAAAQGTYAGAGTPSVTYDYGYGRTYDTTKTYYQQTSTATYQAAAQPYAAHADATAQPATKVTGYQTAQYVAGPTRNNVPQQQAKPVVATTPYNANQAYAPQTAYQQNPQANAQPKQPPATTTSSNYSSYDAALYSAATMYAVQQTNKPNNGPNPGWQGFKKGNMKTQRPKPQPKPQQLHYCEVCKISCAGPQTYREHLEGQKHKRREASLKMAATAVQTSQNRGNNLHCELCGVTCTGNDAYAAHVRGSKHQKVVKLHQKLGKPIPTVDPNFKKPVKVNFVPAGGAVEGSNDAAALTAGSVPPSNVSVQQAAATVPSDATMTNPNKVESMEDDSALSLPEDDIKPVGNEYIEEIKGEDGKMIKFNCKLCECGFNDPNAKEMHMKGRRHRLQYKRKVQPDLVVDLKPTPRQKRIAEAKAQRAAMQADFWNRQRNLGDDSNDIGDGMYWDERRRFDNEFDNMPYNIPWNRGFPPGRPAPPFIRAPMHAPFFGMVPPGRARPETFDDRHVVAKHAEIYPKEEELQLIQRIVSHTERALKFVSDALTDKSAQNVTNGVNKVEAPATETKTETDETNATKPNESEAANSTSAERETKPKEDGRDNQLFSFHKEAEGSSIRLLKGVMRVGLLAKGLLLQGDKVVQLVVLCAEKPTVSLLKRVAAELPVQLKQISEDHQFTVTMEPEESAVLVSDDTITVKVFLTSPLLRDPQQQDSNIAATATEQTVPNPDDLLPRDPCLQALAALRHAKWFQARATGLQSCVMIIRVLRDLCQRVHTWTPLSQWALELLTEKIISSAGMPLSPGDCLRRVMEALSTGLLINGPGLMDPCEKDPLDALLGLTKQQREDLTVSAQTFLRMIAFRQIYKVLGMDLLPPQKFAVRQWRFGRKRRRSGNEGAESEGDSKIVKKDAENTSMETSTTETTSVAADPISTDAAVAN